MDDEEKKLKIYEVFNRRLTEEVKEFYLLSSVFLVLLTGIFGISEKISVDFQFQLLIGGLSVAFIWFVADINMIMWKRWWHGRNIKLESIIFANNEEFKKISEISKKTKPSLIHLTAVFTLLPMGFTFLFAYLLNAGQPLLISIIILEFITLALASYIYTPFTEN